MQQAAQGMSETANKATDRASFVATACQQASSNVQTVASAAGQLSSSITEISQRSRRLQPWPTRPPPTASAPTTPCRGWPWPPSKIGEVIDLINQIA